MRHQFLQTFGLADNALATKPGPAQRRSRNQIILRKILFTLLRTGFIPSHEHCVRRVMLRECRGSRKPNMKTTIAVLSAGLLSFGLVLPSHAAIVGWDFSSGMSPSQGSGTLTTIANFGETVGVSGGFGNPAPSLLFSPGGTGGSFTIQISGTGLSGFSVTYDGLAASPPLSQTWTYSTDNVTFTPLAGGPSPLTASWATYTADFSGVSALNGQSAVYLRDSFAGDAAFDNITVSAVPEPVNVALVVFGLCVGGVSVGRRMYSRVSA